MLCYIIRSHSLALVLGRGFLSANSVGVLASILLQALEHGRIEERLDHLQAAITAKRENGRRRFLISIYGRL
jgi:hypothetical protein